MRTTICSALLIGVLFPTALFAQGRCQHAAGTPSCRTDAITPVFASTGWNTTALDHITFRVVDARAEAAFYAALLGWTVRQSNGNDIVMDMGGHGNAVFRSSPAASLQPAGAPAGTTVRSAVDEIGFVIAPWNANRVGAELRQRGLSPVVDNDAAGFESFHFKGPDGLDLQISNRLRYATKSGSAIVLTPPFAPTGWRMVWLDHFSLRTANYKTTASFFENLLGWKPTYDEGSQNELLIGDIGDIIVRGGNPFDPEPSRNPVGVVGRIDHISLGIAPWDTDGVQKALESRHLSARADTDGGAEIHVSSYKSYHTQTPNGYNLQVSNITRGTRLIGSQNVKPRPPSATAGGAASHRAPSAPPSVQDH